MPEIDTAHEAVPATEQAEKRTEETHRFMRSVRRATRRKYTPEEKIRIVLEGCRREGEADTQHCAGCHPTRDRAAQA